MNVHSRAQRLQKLRTPKSTRDKRMEIEIKTADYQQGKEKHSYTVAINLLGGIWSETQFKDRHYALQAYWNTRLHYSDYASEPANYLVRFFCDGKEYLCDQETWPWNAEKDRNKSCRQMTSFGRPFPWSRKIP
jgi:hypothetical protein